MRIRTIEAAKQYVKENTDAELLETEWLGNTAMMRFRCACGKEFKAQWNRFRCQGQTRCNDCAKAGQYAEKRLTDDDLRARIAKCSDSEWVSGEYKNQKSKLTFRCSCGNLFTVACSTFLYQPSFLKCPSCSGKLKGDLQKMDIGFIADYAVEHGAVLLSTEYVSASEPLMFQCSCGRKFKRSWNSFYSGKAYRCLRCTRYISKGSLILEQRLIELGLFYEREKRFPDCVYKRPLPFDFYIPDQNMCIEFDGEQHYRPVAFGKKEDDFEELKKRDAIKDQYCKEHGITLVRVPYYALDFADIVISSKLIPREAQEVKTPCPRNE